jgi:hypothetical protein
VWVNNKRWARRTDELDCGARIGEGEATVLIGAAAAEASERSPRDDDSWLEDTLRGVLRSSGVLDDRRAGYAGELGAALAGGQRDPRHQGPKRHRGALGPELASLLANGDPGALDRIFD